MQDALQDPSRLWNSDETAVCIDPERKTVAVPKGMKDVLFIKRCSAKMKVTAMATISAKGDSLLPFLVLPYVRRLQWMDKEITCPFALSSSGWMKKNIFLQYLETISTKIERIEGFVPSYFVH